MKQPLPISLLVLFCLLQVLTATAQENYTIIADFLYDHIAEGDLWYIDNYEEGFRISRNGKYGYIDFEKGFVIDCQFDGIGDFSQDGLAIIKNDNKFGLIDKTGKIIIDCQYNGGIGSFSKNGLAILKNDGKYGFIDKTGMIVINYQFDKAYSFSENNLAAVKKSDKWGYIDSKGETIIDYQFDDVYSFYESDLAGVEKNGKWGFIDKTGDLVIETQFDSVSFFGDNSLVAVKKDGKWGYINKKGKIVINYQFDKAYPFSKERFGLAAVEKDNKRGYINPEGLMIINSFCYSDIDDINKELVAAERNGKWGYINRKGEVVIDFQFDLFGDFSEGLAAVCKNDKWGFIDPEGQFAVDCQFNYTYGFSEGLAAVRKNGKWGFINKKGQLVIDFQFDKIGGGDFSEGLIAVCKNDKWGFIDKNGQLIIDFQFYDVSSFSEGLAYVEIKKGTYNDGIYSSPKGGYIDKNGKLITSNLSFCYGYCFKNGLAYINNGQGKSGFIDINEEFIIDFQFEDRCTFKNGLIWAKKNGKWGLIKIKTPSDKIEEYVKPKLTEWQQKGKYESTAEYTSRVTELNRKTKYREFVDEAVQQIAPTYCNYNSIITNYDGDNQTFKISILGLQAFYISVPRSEAETFDKSVENMQFTDVQYAIDKENNFFIKQANFYNSGTAQAYNYSSSTPVEYDEKQFNVNFAPLAFIPDENKQQVTTTEKNINIGPADVDINIPENPQANEKTFVVIIANENYLREVPVQYAANDGKIFREYCEKTLGIPANHIHYVQDATYGTMRTEIKWVTDIMDVFSGQANVIFYYAGHGMPNTKDNSAYLLPSDGTSSDYEVALKLGDLYSRLSSVPSQGVTVILDACFSGTTRNDEPIADNRPVGIVPEPEELTGNMVVLSAASGDETAASYAEKRHGLFTYFLLKKLQETKGNVNYKTLSDYIIQNVRQLSVIDNTIKSQTPVVNVSYEIQNTWGEWNFLK